MCMWPIKLDLIWSQRWFVRTWEYPFGHQCWIQEWAVRTREYLFGRQHSTREKWSNWVGTSLVGIQIWALAYLLGVEIENVSDIALTRKNYTILWMELNMGSFRVKIELFLSLGLWRSNCALISVMGLWRRGSRGTAWLLYHGSEWNWVRCYSEGKMYLFFC